MRLGLLASGRGSNAEAILDAIDAGDLDAQAVVLICDRPAAAMEVARRHDVPARLLPRRDFSDRRSHQTAIRDALLEAGAEVVALAGFAAILDPVVVDAYEERILNIHPSLLPAFAGAIAPEPQRLALEAGVPSSGCTVHLVTREVDAGPILAQAEVPILPGDTVESLSARILAAEHQLYPATLSRFISRLSGGATRSEEP